MPKLSPKTKKIHLSQTEKALFKQKAKSLPENILHKLVLFASNDIEFEKLKPEIQAKIKKYNLNNRFYHYLKKHYAL